jgi:hypothetical protein
MGAAYDAVRNRPGEAPKWENEPRKVHGSRGARGGEKPKFLRKLAGYFFIFVKVMKNFGGGIKTLAKFL